MLKNKEKLIWVVFGIALLLVVVFSLPSNNKNKSSEYNKTLGDITDNYSMSVIRNINDETVSMTIRCDKNICTYESDDLEYKSILAYGSRKFTLTDTEDLDNAKLIEINTNEENELINEKYYNLDIIKSLIEVCNDDKKENNTVYSHITLERYLKEYNYTYNEINKTDINKNISVVYGYNSSRINNILIDYKLIDNYFNNTSYDKYTLKINITGINNNNFDSLKDYIDSLS